MVKTILLTNYKGGVGKSTINSVFTYILAKKGFKVLGIDFDPQGHLQKTLEVTFNKKANPLQSFSKGLRNGNLTNSIVPISENIDLIPADKGLSEFGDDVANLSKSIRYSFLKNALDAVKDNYDYIVIDTPPTFNTIVYNSLEVADAVALVMQTEAHARDSSIDATEELVNFQKNYESNFKFVGTILYLFHEAKVDRLVTEEAKQFFGEALFHSMVETQERVNWWNYFGIAEEGYWDKKAMKMYDDVLKELLERVD